MCGSSLLSLSCVPYACARTHPIQAVNFVVQYQSTGDRVDLPGTSTSLDRTITGLSPNTQYTVRALAFLLEKLPGVERSGLSAVA